MGRGVIFATSRNFLSGRSWPKITSGKQYASVSFEENRLVNSPDQQPGLIRAG